MADSATPIDKDEREISKEKKQLLRVLKKLPHRPRTEWAVELGWLDAPPTNPK